MSSEFSWQSRIVGLTEAYYNILQSEIAYPTAQASQIFGYDILRDDEAAWADDRGKPYDVIAAARADVRDGHPGLDAQPTHELTRLAGIVALLFIVPDRADDLSHRAIGRRKGDSWRARFRHEVLGRA